MQKERPACKGTALLFQTIPFLTEGRKSPGRGPLNQCLGALTAVVKGDMQWFFLVVKVNCLSSVFNTIKSI